MGGGMGKLVAGTHHEAAKIPVSGKPGDRGGIGLPVRTCFGRTVGFRLMAGLRGLQGSRRHAIRDGNAEGRRFSDDEGERFLEGGKVVFLNPEVMNGIRNAYLHPFIRGSQQCRGGKPPREGIGSHVLPEMFRNVLPEKLEPV